MHSETGPTVDAVDLEPWVDEDSWLPVEPDPEISDGARHRIELVRPGPTSLRWLRETVARLQADDRLRPVTVLVPSPYVGIVVRRALAVDGCANVEITMLQQLVARIVGFGAGIRRRAPLNGVVERVAVRKALRLDQTGLLRGVAEQRSVHDALVGLFRELARLDDVEPTLAALAARGDVTSATVQAFRHFKDLTRAYYDVPERTRLATGMLEQQQGRRRHCVGALVLYLPPRLDGPSLTLLGRLGRDVPIVAGLARVDEAEPDASQHEVAEHLATALRTEVQAGPDQTPAAAVTPSLLLVSAPSPTEEVHQVVRRIAVDLEDGVPLWRVGVLTAQDEPYGSLVREALDAAELPWQATIGRPLSTSRLARSFLDLLALPERRFARDAVLEWLGGRPPLNEPADDPLLCVPRSAWERISRDAQVVEGADQWLQRCQSYAARRLADTRPADPVPASAVPANVTHALRIAEIVAELERATRPPTDGAPWADFVAWAEDLRARYLPLAPAWSASEHTASLDFDRALASLADAEPIEPGITARAFRVALEAILDERAVPEGRAGVGIAVGRVGSVMGAQFDRLYVLGAAEGSLPARPPADPLTMADLGPDLLGRQQRFRLDDRRAWLATLAAADHGRIIVSYARSNGAARAAYPSRWLLELAARLEGRSIYASDVARLVTTGRPWLLWLASTHDALSRVPRALGGDTHDRIAAGSLADLRLADLLAWRTRGRDLAHHPLAARPELPLAAALRATRARRSRAFTPYDGNLAELAGLSRRMIRAFENGTASATAVERWSGCHFQYLLQNVVRVRPTDRPEEQWRIDSGERGGLFHRILDRFYRELAASGRLRGPVVFGPADHRRIEQLAGEESAALERAGKVGHPLTWQAEREEILADLHELLERETAWGAETGVVPALFEHRFGYEDQASWPAATVTLADGRRVSFLGAVDRVDFGPDDAVPLRALIVDYKSGSNWSYKEIKDDPLLGGRHVQLALYARALRAAVEQEHGAEQAARAEIQAEYRFVSSRGEFKRLPVLSTPELDGALDRVVQRVADGVARGVFLPVPGEEDWEGRLKNCAYCAYDRVCTTNRGTAWERKSAEVELILG
jgi:ATP-dependent helicase/nuclease subunit B